jgi:predicted CXXCH cytochrome family protein
VAVGDDFIAGNKMTELPKIQYSRTSAFVSLLYKMKNSLVTLTAMTFVVCFSSFIDAAITGTKHDFSASGDTTGQGFALSSERCNVCHIPHNANFAASLLWNHEVSTVVYSTYNSYTLDSAGMGQPDGSSKLCLSCHDGTNAIDSFGENAGGTEFMDSGSNKNLGTSLADDHPVSFIYDAALATADGELHDPAATSSGLGGTIQKDLLFNDRIQCASCHDPHNDSNGNFLRIRNDASTLCLTCHIK